MYDNQDMSGICTAYRCGHKLSVAEGRSLPAAICIMAVFAEL